MLSPTLGHHEPFELAWERQPDDRQWEYPKAMTPNFVPDADDQRDRFGDLNLLRLHPSTRYARTHMSYNQWRPRHRCG